MKRQTDDKTTDRQRRNMQFLDERLEFLDTIHKMIDTEMEKRGREADDSQAASAPHISHKETYEELPTQRKRQNDDTVHMTFCQCLSACLSRWLRRLRDDEDK